MSDIPIGGMDFKQLRNEVQLLRDELAITKRKYEDLLYNLDTENIADGAITAEKLSADMVFSDAVITQAVYAEYGDIAELTVDSLNTGPKARRFLEGDTSDLDYVEISEQHARWITGSVVLDGSVPLTQHHTNRSGQMLYWQSEDKKTMSAKQTQWPVMVYVYTEFIKRQIHFSSDGIHNVARDVWGTGSGYGDNDKLSVYKPAGKAVMEYRTEMGARCALEYHNQGIVAHAPPDGLSVKNIKISPLPPDEGQMNDGDIWLQYEEV